MAISDFWECDFDGLPECSWWLPESEEYCTNPAVYRVRPKGSPHWWAQSCERHLELASSIYSDAEIEEYPYYKDLSV